MAEFDEAATQRDVIPNGIAADLAAAGFGDAVEIGRGGFGVVYRCYEHSLERFVAVKLLASEIRGGEREQFVREQRALGRLSGHPHILQVLQVDITATGLPYIVMPYHARGSLDGLLRKQGPVRWPDVLAIGVKMSGALAAAHALGIVHRDLKPGNILLTDYGEPQLADFGIAQFGDTTTASMQLIQGTPAFTAPEVLSGGTPGTASDIYGLGATLFSLLAGHAAFARRKGEPLEVQLARIATAPIPDMREHDIPDAVCTVVENAMSTTPMNRPGSAVEFGEQLREVQRELGQAVDVMAVPPNLGESDTGAAHLALAVRSPGSVTPPPPPITSTKFRPPAAPRTSIPRTRLLEVLRRSGDRRLTLIHGPAGFGKTTVALQWGRVLESEGLAMAWLTADSDDDNVVWFLSHLVDAIRRVRPELARELGMLLEERSSDTTRYVLSALIDEIHDSGRAMVLVIDDWHRVTGETTIAAMDYLLEHGCRHLRIVIAGRTRSGLPLTRMLVHDELVEIDIAALRFDAAETRAFLLDTNDLPLRGQDVNTLCELTEGWPAALQLATLSLRGRDDPAAFISGLTGRHQVIGDYLAENVLDSLEPRLLDFLMSTSVVGKVRADLAATLSGRSDSQLLLEETADRNLFLQRLDEVGEWFRYHRLFADYLQRRLVRDAPDRLAVLHRQASDWFAEHDMIADAVDHAMAAGDPQLAVDLVEARGASMIEHSRMATFLGLTAKLPGSLIISRPRLQLYVSWANVGLQRPQPFRAALRAAVAALDAGYARAAEAPALRAEAAIVASVQQSVVDRFDAVPDIVARNLQEPATSFLTLWAANLAAVDGLNRFDRTAVQRWHRAATADDGSRHPFLVMHSHCVAGLAAYEQLDIPNAEELFESAVVVARRHGAQTQSSRLAGALLGELRYQQGRYNEAEALLAASATLGRQGGPVDFLLATYGTGARLAALQGGRAAAGDLLDNGAAFAEREELPRLAARIVNERIRIGLPIPDAVRARLTDLPLYRQHDNRIRAATAELEQDSVIRLLLAEPSPEGVENACRRAEQLVRAIRNQPRPLALARAQLLRVCCLWAAGRRDDAKAALAGALSRTVCDELPRLAADAGPQIIDITAVAAWEPGPASSWP